jgi:hypothetical protein
MLRGGRWREEGTDKGEGNKDGAKGLKREWCGFVWVLERVRRESSRERDGGDGLERRRKFPEGGEEKAVMRDM